MNRGELLEELPGYNEVTGHLMPNGELCIMLSHRATMDNAVIVRIRADNDIITLFKNEDEEDYTEVNEGGDWPR